MKYILVKYYPILITVSKIIIRIDVYIIKHTLFSICKRNRLCNMKSKSVSDFTLVSQPVVREMISWRGRCFGGHL